MLFQELPYLILKKPKNSVSCRAAKRFMLSRVFLHEQVWQYGFTFYCGSIVTFTKPTFFSLIQKGAPVQMRRAESAV